jgi:NAD+ diphosphatase
VSQRALARLTTSDIKPLLGPEPWIGQGQNPGEFAEAEISILEAARFSNPKIVFLGLEEPQGVVSALPSSEFSAKSEDPEVVAGKIKGTPYFSLDVSEIANEEVEKVLQASGLGKDGWGLKFTEPRPAMGGLDVFDAAVFAEARSMVDWNTRNKVSRVCAMQSHFILIPAIVLVLHGLWFACLFVMGGMETFMLFVAAMGRENRQKTMPNSVCDLFLNWSISNAFLCRRGLHNSAHPRTDPVVIMLVVNETGDKILMGRNDKWPGVFYSALAGFMEPGETFEDSVKRELREEAGIDVWDVRYHSTQPWVSVMITMVAC